MIQISEYSKAIQDTYYLDIENESIYNAELDEWQDYAGKSKVKLKDTDGKTKEISLKTLYDVCNAGVYCIDNIESLEGEEWRVIPNTQGQYYASNKGRIKSFKGTHSKIMQGTISRNGYRRVDLWVKGADGKQHRTTKTYHCLIAEAFYGSPNGKVCHHKDGNKLNNALDNIEYLTQAEHYRVHNRKEDKGNGESLQPKENNNR